MATTLPLADNWKYSGDSRALAGVLSPVPRDRQVSLNAQKLTVRRHNLKRSRAGHLACLTGVSQLLTSMCKKSAQDSGESEQSLEALGWGCVSSVQRPDWGRSWRMGSHCPWPGLQAEGHSLRVGAGTQDPAAIRGKTSYWLKETARSTGY